MAENSAIEWCNHTFNPVRGCTKISPGCANCYAERQANRNPAVLGLWGPRGSRILAAEAQWALPRKWNAQAEHDNRRARVFCASIGDVFEEWDRPLEDSHGNTLYRDPNGQCFIDLLPGRTPCNYDHARERLWKLIRDTPFLDWLLLTKRPENIARMMPHGDWPNVWLGTSVETQEYHWRIDALKEAPQVVPVRFVSAEPLLGPLSLWDALQGIHWCIIGGESGGEAREMKVAWVRSLMDQCSTTATAVFVKQLGKIATVHDNQGRRVALNLVHDAGHGGDMRDWPTVLRVREFPTPLTEVYHERRHASLDRRLPRTQRPHWHRG